MQTIQIEGGVKIPVSKGKTFLLWLLCIGFVAMGVFLFQENPVMSVLTVSFFGLGVLAFPVMFFHSTSGLYITNRGINIITPFVNDSFVGWNEIEGFSTYQVSRNKMILVHLKDADAFLQRQSKVKQFLGVASGSISGSPYAITVNSYQTNFSDLMDLLDSEFKKHKTE